ncbi:MAG: hypothetical protein ACP5GI_00290 [Sulfolobales archaeon]
MSNISEIRSVQEIKGSYILYLPKEWCSINKISKGSRVIVKGSRKRLMIEAADKGEEIINLRIDDYDERSLRYSLISLYVLGYKNIRLESKRNIDLRTRREIRSILKFLRGYEIYEEGRNYVLIRESISRTDLEQLMRKEYNSLFFLLKLLRDLIEKKISKRDIDIEDIKQFTDLDLEELDSEIDIARLEIKRIYSKILTDLSIDPGIDPRILSNIIMISNILERIADHVVEALRIIMSKDILEFKSGRTSEILDELDRASLVISNYLDKLLKEIFNINIGKEFSEEEVGSIIKSLADIIEAKRLFREKIREGLGGNPLFEYHITRVFDYMTDIAEYLMDIYTELIISRKI